MARRPPKPKEVAWKVYLLSGKMKYQGMVEAPDEASAIRKATEELTISPSLWDRIVVKRDD